MSLGVTVADILNVCIAFIFREQQSWRHSDSLKCW